MPELTLCELRAAQAAVRGEPVDATVLALLLGVDRPTAERLLRRGVPTWARERVVLGRLVGRLRVDTTPDELDEAIAVRQRLVGSKAITPAPDLMLHEMRAAAALLRGQDAEIGAASAFLGCSPAGVRRLLLEVCDSPVLDSLLIATLLVRLHGRRVGLAEMGEAFLATFGNRAAELLREVAH